VEPRFTHGDLIPINVLVDDDANLTGIIDWENAGWTPPHFEAAHAIFFPSHPNWKTIVRGVWRDAEAELRAEEACFRCWGY